MYTNREKANEARREVSQRVRVYDRLVSSGRMTRSNADRKKAIMQEICDDYEARAFADEQQADLFPRVTPEAVQDAVTSAYKATHPPEIQGYVCKCGARILYGTKHIDCPAECTCIDDEDAGGTRFRDFDPECPVHKVKPTVQE